MHIPYKYFSQTEKNKLDDSNEKIIYYGKLLDKPLLFNFFNRKLIEFHFFSESKKKIFKVISYNFKLKNALRLNQRYIIIGKKKNKDVIILNYISEKNDFKKLTPIYHLPSGVSQNYFHKIVRESLMKCEINDLIPIFFKKKYKLLDKIKILEKIHFPDNFNDVNIAKRYLKYEECFDFSMKNELNKYILNKNSIKNIKKNISHLMIDNFIKKLDIILTKSQNNAIQEILSDMNKNKIMFRILQGDVGTGKTLVAIVALYGNFLRGEQGCLMAPTDSLVRQHYETLKMFFKNVDIKIEFLVSKITNKEKERIKKDILEKKIDILIGTQSLFSKILNYNSLGLIVIDEQHRFGVDQKNQLICKGNCADILLMSATPIPRTLALTIYGNIDITVLKDFPCGKKQIITKIVKKNDDIIDRLINESLDNNKQVYIIAPAIESELKDNVKSLFNDYSLKYHNKVALLHGKMSQDEKIKVLNDFSKNKISILVSTTVVEVGLDIKTANLIIIYDAINFGLASLHQLRGRVGRDGLKSYCLLVCDDLQNINIERLKILETVNDGFEIANMDLKIRGSGELDGSKQSGIPEFKFVDIVEDVKIFMCARKDACFIIDHMDMFKDTINKYGII